MPGVAVCIPTFCRNEELRILLESLTGLRPVDAEVSVVVADNDPGEGAKATVESFRDRLPNLRYAVEPERGIAATRNRLVGIARELGAEFVAFVDDDEHVAEGWLAELLAAQTRYAADAVIGRVIFEHDERTPRWIRASRDQRTRQTGTAVPRPATGNSLISIGMFVGENEWFSVQLPRGEDTFFFMKAQRTGARIVFCDEAVVWERVPPSRARLVYIYRSTFADAVNYSRCLELLGLPIGHRADRIARCVARVGLGIALTPLVLVDGRSALLRSSRMIVGGVGGLVGLNWRRRHSHP